MTDLSERLRKAATVISSDDAYWASELFEEAAAALDAKDAEIARLRAERDDAHEQLALRSPSNVERDMQVILGINNELLALLAEAERALEPFARAVDDHEVDAVDFQEIDLPGGPTIGDLRNARTTLAKLKARKDQT